MRLKINDKMNAQKCLNSGGRKELQINPISIMIVMVKFALRSATMTQVV